MRKTTPNLLILFSALALTFLGTRVIAAARPGQQPQNEQAEKKQPAPNSTVYRVSYRVNELENGKTINSRSYALMARTDSTATVRLGSMVPYWEGNSRQYRHVGMNISCDISMQQGSLLVHTKLDMEAFPGHDVGQSVGSYPVIGSFQLENSTAATLGKPAFVGSADDVASNRHYVIEVTVTEAK